MYIRDEQARDVSRGGKSRKKRMFRALGEQDPVQPTPEINTSAPASTPASSIPNSTSPILEPAVTTSVSTRPLRTITANVASLVDEAGEAGDDEPDAPLAGTVSIPIQQLFDFSKKHWVDSHSWGAVGSLEDELELFDPLNLDAPSDLDLEIDLDETNDNILTL